MIPLGSNTNCETDDDTFLALQYHSSSNTDTTMNQGNTDQNLEVENIDHGTQADDVQENIVTYIAGYICKKVLANHDCQICKTELVKSSPDLESPSELMIHFKAYCTQSSDFGSLTVPTDNFTSFIMLCENIFVKYFNSSFHIDNIAANLVGRISATTKGKKGAT